MKMMGSLIQFRSNTGDQRGATAVMVSLVLFLLLGCAMLAIDTGHLFVARNELQNAADAGALAGARFLYNEDGSLVNEGANQIAYDAATANKSEKLPVDVNWSGGNAGDVQRGHWSFATRTFTPNASLLPVDLWDRSADELDADPDFINAVRVVSRREAPAVAAFFARIFGHEDFRLAADAVAYIGFAGTLAPGEGDQPIAICKQSIIDENGKYSGCNIGRMLNSGGSNATHNTAGWTNFSQPCETANAFEMRGLICGGGNPGMLTYGSGIGAVGGVQDNVFRELRDCWISSDPTPNPVDGLPNDPWELKLPVVDCPGNNVSNCAPLLGAVTVQVVFISPEGGTPSLDDAPREMHGHGSITDWPTLADLATPGFATNGEVRWASFVNHFNLKNVDDLYADYAKKSMYFLPSCEPEEPAGNTGGDNYGVLARIPVLVK
jgi:hypothetical protein